MRSPDIRIDEDFELAVADGARFETLFVRVVGDDAKPAPADPDELRRLAVAGSAEAQFCWAHCLLQGYGVARDADAALRWFKLAARSGAPDALNMVGRCYELGWGTRQDHRVAADWYRQAAEKHDAWAEFNLGSLHAQGLGVNYDERLALSLLVRSARQGNPKAMNMIGRYRETAADSPRRRQVSSALWYRWAAERGCFRGQFHHGRNLIAGGNHAAGLRWLRASLDGAPPDFRSEALALLHAHADAEVREFAVAYGAGLASQA